MFHISLLQTNGSDKGTRHKVSSSPFVIGRGSGCDLTFPSRTISRRHCSIVFDESSVLIRDLGSHNGTATQGKRLDANVPQKLSHHDRIQIGKYQFRVSIRDAKTREPYRPELIEHSTLSGAVIEPPGDGADTAKLLSELDELASALDLGGDGQSRSPRSAPWNTPADDEPSVIAIASGEKPTSPQPATTAGEDDSEETTLMLGAELANSTDADDSDASGSDEKSKEPQRLPEHLRRKSPTNSRNAAAEALKNLWDVK